MKKIILCEGPSDEAILKTLIKVNGLDIAVAAYDGKDNLENFVETLQGSPDYRKIETLAVTRDADENEKDAFKSVRGLLKRMGFANLPEESGRFSGETPRAGIFVVGRDGRGSIDDICLGSVKGRPGFSCVDEYFRCVNRSEPGAKARVWVWLLSHPDFPFSLRKGGKEAYWNWDHPAFGPLTEFLRAM